MVTRNATKNDERYETNMLLHNTKEYDNNFQQHGVPYYH
jgi:hypothetical protein